METERRVRMMKVAKKGFLDWLSPGHYYMRKQGFLRTALYHTLIDLLYVHKKRSLMYMVIGALYYIVWRVLLRRNHACVRRVYVLVNMCVICMNNLYVKQLR